MNGGFFISFVHKCRWLNWFITYEFLYIIAITTCRHLVMNMCIIIITITTLYYLTFWPEHCYVPAFVDIYLIFKFGQGPNSSFFLGLMLVLDQKTIQHTLLTLYPLCLSASFHQLDLDLVHITKAKLYYFPGFKVSSETRHLILHFLSPCYPSQQLIKCAGNTMKDSN